MSIIFGGGSSEDCVNPDYKFNPRDLGSIEELLLYFSYLLKVNCDINNFEIRSNEIYNSLTMSLGSKLVYAPSTPNRVKKGISYPIKLYGAAGEVKVSKETNGV